MVSLMKCNCQGDSEKNTVVENCTCTLAIAEVPIQPFGQLYDAKTALQEGTIFKSLNLTFYKGGPYYGN